MNNQKESPKKPKTLIIKVINEKIDVGESGIIRTTFIERVKVPKNIRRSILMLILCTLIAELFGKMFIGVLAGFIISLIWIFFGGPTEIEREKVTEGRF